LAPCAIEACTFINTYSDLKPQVSPPDAAPEMDSSALPDQAAEAAPPPDVIVAQPSPSDGVIVIGGTVSTDAGDENVLTALDPRTGTEFPKARVPMNVAAVLYDPTPGREYWYVFESGGAGIYPTPTDPYFLHVRQIDRVTGAWTELAKVQVPAGVSFLTTATLAGAVSYVAYGNNPDASAPLDAPMPIDGTDAGAVMLPTVPGKVGLVTIDTHDLAHLTNCVYPLTAQPNSVIGTTSPTLAQGGYATLGNYPSKGSMTPFLVPAECDSINTHPVPQPTITLPTGNPGFGMLTANTTAQILVGSKGFGPGPTLITAFDPTTGMSTGNITLQGQFSGFNDGNIHPLAYSECLNTAYVIGTNTDTNVWFASLAGAGQQLDDGGALPITATDQPMGHSGQAVYFEPFTKTVLLPFSQGDNYKLTAFRFTGVAYTSITNTPLWQPPADLRPNFVATRIPVPFPCTEQDH
jgi:hypothetical protein